MTATDLAKEAGIFERYAREWLEQQAAAGILAVDDVTAEPDERRYHLPPGHIEPLLDLDSPYSIAPFCKSFAAVSGAMPDIVSAFRSGGLVPWSAYGHDMVEAQGDFNRPWLVGSLGVEYLPSIPDLDARLSSEPGCQGRRRRVWRRLGSDRARQGLSEHHRRGFRPRRALDRDRVKERTGGRCRGSCPIRSAGWRRSRSSKGIYDLAVVVEAIARSLATRLGVDRHQGDAQARRHVDRCRRANRGLVHGTGERDRAALLRLQRPVLPAVGDGGRDVRGDGHRHAAVDVREVRQGCRVRRGLGPAHRTRLPSLLSARCR